MVVFVETRLAGASPTIYGASLKQLMDSREPTATPPGSWYDVDVRLVSNEQAWITHVVLVASSGWRSPVKSALFFISKDRHPLEVCV
jgi:hypothetical protein